MQSWPVPWTPIWLEASTSRRLLQSPSHTPSSAESRRRGGHLSGSDVGGYCGGLAHRCGQGTGTPVRRLHARERGESCIGREASRRRQISSSEEEHMCPACIASTAVMVAGAGSTGGILAVCIGKFRKFFRANRLGLFQKTKEKSYGNKQRERQGTGERAYRDEDTLDRVAAGVGGCAAAVPREGEGLDSLP